MKRILAISVLILAAAAAFASDASWGVAAMGGFYVNEMTNSLADPAVSTETRETYLPLDVMLFIDVSYFEMDLGFALMTAGHRISRRTIDGVTATMADAATGETKGYVTLALFGKYPVPIGLITFTPFLGVQLDANLMVLDASGNDLRASMSSEALAGESMCWIKAGAGVDVPFSYRGYFRSEVIMGYKLFSGAERAAYLNVTKAGFSALWFSLEPDLRLCVGWRL